MNEKIKVTLCAPTDEAGRDFDEQIRSMKECGIHLAEIRDIVGKNVLELSIKEATDCYQKLKDNGIKVWAISSPIGKKDLHISFEDFKKRVKKAIEMAKAFRVDKIRVFSFFDYKGYRDEVIKRLQYVVDEAKKENIIVCLENELGSHAETVEGTLDLLNNVKGIKSVYDSSNFIQKGEPSEKTLKMVFPRAYYVHFKDGIHKNNDAEITPVGEGEANILKLLSLIKKDMTLSIEHHLRFAQNSENYNDIKHLCRFVYPNVREAFIDAVKHARKVLKEAGYKEIEEGIFVRE